MASEEMLAAEAAPAEGLRHASADEQVGRAALFSAAVCIIGVLVSLIGQLGWWAALAGPAYLAATAIATMLANGRSQAMLAVALTAGSMATFATLARLAGFA